jgi:ADP-ribose pyrophosphatase YjhB (NUDIX family)
MILSKKKYVVNGSYRIKRGMQTHLLSRLVILVDGYLLLTKTYKKDGSIFYFLPGGHLEHNEPIQYAAKRELKEECGLDPSQIENISLVGVYEHSWDNKGEPYHEINFIQTCKVNGLNPAIPVQSLESHINFEWVPLGKITEINLLPHDFIKYLPQWMKNVSNSAGFFGSGMIIPEPGN